MTDLSYLQELEKLVVSTADEVLDQYFLQTTASLKQDGSIVTEADITLQARLNQELKQLSPEVAMLGEEMSPEQQQQTINSGSPYWCLDPLDGTNNFHHGVPLFAVSLALVSNREISLGLVYDPIRKEVFSAIKGSGLRINGQPVDKPDQPKKLNRCLASVDLKRLDMSMKRRLLEHMPFKSQRNVGTCALEWAWLAAGRVQLLLHGGEKFWDYAAGTLLLDEAGGCSCSNRDEAIYNNSLESRPVIAASNAQLHESWMGYLLD